jgi:hypothetical protein
MDSPLFDEREKAVIRWGELVSKNEVRYDKARFDTLSRYFDARESSSRRRLRCFTV